MFMDEMRVKNPAGLFGMNDVPTRLPLMKIVHFGSFTTRKPCGVANAGAMLAGALADRGHTITIASPSSRENRETFSESGSIQTLQYQRAKNLFLYHKQLDQIISNLKKEGRIQIAHLYSVFSPENIIIKRTLQRHQIPYVWSPQGGLDAQIMGRGRFKKAPYWAFFEKPLMQGASGIHCLTEVELNRIQALGYLGETAVIGNAVEIPSQTLRVPKLRMIYLGRGDIKHKGLDRLIQLFTHVREMVPSATLHLYGCQNAATPLAKAVNETDPTGVAIVFHPPVYGSDKSQVFSEASFYIQASRWEGFGVSIAEAMANGVPVAVSSECALSSFLAESQACIVLRDFGSVGAAAIANLMRDASLADALGKQGAKVALENFSSSVIAERMEVFYRKVLGSKDHETHVQ
jgi:glycosyltransferase involved in cell wall biosynthesis